VSHLYKAPFLIVFISAEGSIVSSMQHCKMIQHFANLIQFLKCIPFGQVDEDEVHSPSNHKV